MVMYRGKYHGTYWNEGYMDKDLRCGLDLLGRWKDKTLPEGKDHNLLMLVFRDDMNGHEAAGKDFNASLRDAMLLLQILRVVKEDASIAIPGR